MYVVYKDIVIVISVERSWWPYLSTWMEFSQWSNSVREWRLQIQGKTCHSFFQYSKWMLLIKMFSSHAWFFFLFIIIFVLSLFLFMKKDFKIVMSQLLNYYIFIKCISTLNFWCKIIQLFFKKYLIVCFCWKELQ